MEHKLPPEIKERWTTALRSGKYKQGRTVLRDDQDRYCCLGVLADLCGLQWKKVIDCYAVAAVSSDGFSRQWITPNESLDPAIRLALNQSDRGRRVEVALADMNDSHDNFIQIADWIDQNL